MLLFYRLTESMLRLLQSQTKEPFSWLGIALTTIPMSHAAMHNVQTIPILIERKVTGKMEKKKFFGNSVTNAVSLKNIAACVLDALWVF